MCSQFSLNALVTNFLLISETLSFVLNSHKSEDYQFIEATQQYGYKSEAHTALTEDGYILTIFRMSNPKCQLKKTPVLLMHGLLLSSDCWIDASPDSGLAYLLSDQCFDVWVGNVRGNTYSRKHLHLSPNEDQEFWEFSVDEIGLYDIPATIDYVLSTTGESQLNYIGFSQGGGSYFIMCSERPGYCDKSRIMIGLAPATRHYHTTSLLFRYVPDLVNSYKDLLMSLGIWELFGKGQLTQELLSSVCQNEEMFKICRSIMELADAPQPELISEDVYPRVLNHILAGTSTQNLARYGQSLVSDKFQKYDFGEENVDKYNSTEPPEYNLTAVIVPVVIIYGENDGIVDVKDIEWLASKLPNLKEKVLVRDTRWNHLDMIYSQYIKELVFPKIIEHL